MEILKFKLSGETAFFKKPDVNTYCYFTYGSIHKVALLGILGAILGLEGYNQQKQKNKEYPEFYEKLKDLKVAIVPLNEEGYINKKIQTFNNSVGYASKEEGGNLIVKEQWLEKPEWNIYIQVDSTEICENLKERILNYRFEYIPYLGKNDHYANITEIEVFNDVNVKSSLKNETNKIYGLFKKSCFCINDDIDPLDDIDNKEDESFSEGYDDESEWKYEESLPVSLDKELNQYEKDIFIATNLKLISKENYKEVYNIKGKNIFFF